MSKCYIVAYIIGSYEEKEDKLLHYSKEFNISAKLLNNKYKKWPYYDVSDDPSFLAYELSKNDEGRLTWGICRRDVRNKMQCGDVVLFFGYNKSSTTLNLKQNTYYFVGYATVENKITHKDIWNIPNCKIYQKYCNNLMRMCSRCKRFYYFEPIRYSHKDEWIWKLSDGKIKNKNYRKNIFVKLSNKNKVLPPNVGIKENYIIFCNENGNGKTKIFKKPIEYATWNGNNLNHDASFDTDLKKLIFDGNRDIRIFSSKRRPHRHIVKELKDDLLKKLKEIDG